MRLPSRRKLAVLRTFSSALSLSVAEQPNHTTSLGRIVLSLPKSVNARRNVSHSCTKWHSSIATSPSHAWKSSF
ncbi:hypothetical protein EJ02DRAFT_481459, partial [Clathrospora elynae]